MTLMFCSSLIRRITGCLLLAGSLVLGVPALAADAPPAGAAVDVPPPAGGAAQGDGEIDLGEIDVAGQAPSAVAPAPPSPAPPPPQPARSGAEAKVITGSQIAASGAQNLAELLQRTAGFSVTDSFTGSQATFQGIPSKFSTLLVDGQRVPGSVMDRSDFSQLALDNIERVEVIRGPEASAYTGSSVGAVVNIITRTPAGTGGSYTQGVGSLGFNHEQLSLHRGSDDGREHWLLTADRRLRHTFDIDHRQIDTDGDSFRQGDLFAKFRKEMGPNRLRLQLDWFDEHRLGLAFAPPDLTRNQFTDTRRFQLEGAWRWGLSDGGSLELRHSYGTYGHQLYRYYAGFEATTATRTGFTDMLHDTQLAWQARGDGRGLAAGLQQNHDRLHSDRISAPAGGHTVDAQGYSAYASYVWPLSARWTATGALRYDTQDTFGDAVSPKLSLRYGLSDSASLTAAVGRGYRAPSLRERYYQFASPFGYSVIGNNDLKPESSWDYTLDYDYAGQRSSFHAGAFDHRLHNLIDFSEIQPSPQVFQTVNVGSATSAGLEWSAERRWNLSTDRDGTALRLWGAGWDSTWIARSRDGELGTRLPSSPQWNHALRLFYREPAHRLESQLLLRGVAASYLDLANTDRAPGYTTIDATFSRELGDGRIELDALNLANEVNRRYGPKPGRELRAEYTWEF
jgi:outer membrane receptor for ferrienterochelin and colicins